MNIRVYRKQWGQALAGSDTQWLLGPDRERLLLLALGIVSAWGLSPTLLSPEGFPSSSSLVLRVSQTYQTCWHLRLTLTVAALSSHLFLLVSGQTPLLRENFADLT